MPTYVYQCSKEECEKHQSFEVKQSMKDMPLKVCPLCSQEVSRLIQPSMVVFKGNNWTTNGGSY